MIEVKRDGVEEVAVKVSAKRKATHRAAILDAAARELRLKGADGVGVASVMQAAGLTHGGFYGHFPSRAALVAEALHHALAPAASRFARATVAGDFTAYAARYLSEAHLHDPAAGCPLAAMVTDLARQPPEVRAAAADALRAWFDSAPEGEARARAMAEFARLLGAMTLARAVAGTDDALAAEILAAAVPGAGARGPQAG